MDHLQIIRELLPDINISVVIEKRKGEVFIDNYSVLEVTGENIPNTIAGYLHGLKYGIIKGKEYERKLMKANSYPIENIK